MEDEEEVEGGMIGLDDDDRDQGATGDKIRDRIKRKRGELDVGFSAKR